MTRRSPDKNIVYPPGTDFFLPAYEKDRFQNYDHYLLTMIFNLVINRQQSIIRASMDGIIFASIMRELVNADIVEESLFGLKQKWKLTDAGREVLAQVMCDIANLAAEEPPTDEEPTVGD